MFDWQVARLAFALVAALVLSLAGNAEAVEVQRMPYDGYNVSISADGRTIAFSSYFDLVPANEDGDEFGSEDGGGTYVMDALTGSATRIGRILPPACERCLPTILNTGNPFLSGNGRRVYVTAAHAFLTGNREDSAGGVYMWEGGPSGQVAALESAHPLHMAVSEDGSTVAYSVYEGGYRLFVNGTQVATGAINPSLSANGRQLAYTRQRGNQFAVFVRDTKTGKVRRASSDGAGDPAPGFGSSISPDGRYVAFRTTEALLPRASRFLNVYVKDMKTGRVRLASTNSKNREARVGDVIGTPFLGSQGTSISRDGRYVLFISRARLTKQDRDSGEDLFVKDMETREIIRVPLNGATIGYQDFKISGSGNAAVASSYNGNKGSLMFIALSPGLERCEAPGGPQRFDLTAEERDLVNGALEPTDRELDRARAALVADSKRNPQNKPANDRDLARMKAIDREHDSRFARAAQEDENDVEKFIDDARCKLVEEAESYVDQRIGEKNKTLVTKLFYLKKVFDGSADEAQKKELFKDNVGDLIERIGGKDARTKHSKVILKVNDLLAAHLKGKLKPELEKTIKKEAVDYVKKASKKWFGNDAPELVDHILTLRDVLAGSLSDEQKQQVLKDSVSGLATRILGEGIMKAPQLRALMFGFELGRSFGARIAADLQLIASKELIRDCAVALSASQGAPGAVDYSKPASGVVPSPLYHRGWRCDILPESIVESYPGAVVQATRPDNASFKDKVRWRISTSGPVVTFDPTFSG